MTIVPKLDLVAKLYFFIKKRYVDHVGTFLRNLDMCHGTRISRQYTMNVTGVKRPTILQWPEQNFGDYFVSLKLQGNVLSQSPVPL